MVKVSSSNHDRVIDADKEVKGMSGCLGRKLVLL